MRQFLPRTDGHSPRNVHDYGDWFSGFTAAHGPGDAKGAVKHIREYGQNKFGPKR